MIQFQNAKEEDVWIAFMKSNGSEAGADCAVLAYRQRCPVTPQRSHEEALANIDDQMFRKGAPQPSAPSDSGIEAALERLRVYRKYHSWSVYGTPVGITTSAGIIFVEYYSEDRCEAKDWAEAAHLINDAMDRLEAEKWPLTTSKN